ncbi:MAG: hypothetical protein Q4C76_10365 [Bacillota bacterium]|nr:hypothetical protein [Bacillota bacterium]
MTMTITEKVAYLKGLADGLELDKESSKEAKLLAKVIDILEDIGLAVEDLEDEIEAVEEEVDAISEDLEDVEELVFEDEDDDDFDFGSCCGQCGDLDDDAFFEIECPSCGEDIVIDESILDIGEVTCPNCGDKFSMDLVDEDEEEEDD